MKKNLVCLFSKNNYSRHELDIMRDTEDAEIYKTAIDGVEKGIADIYTMDEFVTDFNNGCIDELNYYMLFISVDDSEVKQWEK